MCIINSNVDIELKTLFKLLKLRNYQTPIIFQTNNRMSHQKFAPQYNSGNRQGGGGFGGVDGGDEGGAEGGVIPTNWRRASISVAWATCTASR